MSNSRLSFEEIEDCFPEGATTDEVGNVVVTAQWLHDFARAVEQAALQSAPAPVEAEPVAYVYQSDLSRLHEYNHMRIGLDSPRCWPKGQTPYTGLVPLYLHPPVPQPVKAPVSEEEERSRFEAKLLADFDVYARTLVEHPHEMRPDMWPNGFPFFEAGWRAGASLQSAPVEDERSKPVMSEAEFDAWAAKVKEITVDEFCYESFDKYTAALKQALGITE